MLIYAKIKEENTVQIPLSAQLQTHWVKNANAKLMPANQCKSTAVRLLSCSV